MRFSYASAELPWRVVGVGGEESIRNRPQKSGSLARGQSRIALYNPEVVRFEMITYAREDTSD